MKLETNTYSFTKCLASSHAAEELPFWEEIYRQAFPNMQSMISHKQNGTHQVVGIDRSIILNNSKQILIDEKLRYRNRNGKAYSDIALEYVANDRRGTPGWVCKSLLSDYIAYAIAPLGVCYLLPVLQLQAAWQANGQQWLQDECRYKFSTPNEGYNTLNVCVKPDELFRAMWPHWRVDFTAYDNGDQI